jgi:hypothetical protein
MGSISWSVALHYGINVFNDKLTILLGPFISYKENEGQWIWPQGL